MSAPTRVIQKCQNCGGDLVFDPTKNGLVCQQCGNYSSVTSKITTEKAFQTLLKQAPAWKKDTIVMRCEHCGAKTVVSNFDLVVRCEYCGAANPVKTKEAPGLCPDTVVTFGLSRENAAKQVDAWLAKRFFVPARFKQRFRDRQLTGVYLPVFTFDANVTAKYNGILVHTNTVTVVIDGNESTQSQTVRRAISDVDTRAFDDLLVLANEEITPQILRRIQPFDSNAGKVFQQSYLAGFTVGQATKDPQMCWSEAKSMMERIIRHQINARYVNSNTRIEDLNLSLDVTNITYKYALLPIYKGEIEYNNKKYPLYLNGQTGKIYGKTPKSWRKILFTFTTMVGMAAGVLIVLAMFL